MFFSGDDLADKFKNLELNDRSACSTLRSSLSEGVKSREENESDQNQRLTFLTNLVFEQQRAYNELFDNYKEERIRNIAITKENRDLFRELLNIKSLRSTKVASFAEKYTQQNVPKISTKTDQNNTNLSPQILSHDDSVLQTQIGSETENSSVTTHRASQIVDQQVDHLQADLCKLREQKHK